MASDTDFGSPTVPSDGNIARLYNPLARSERLPKRPKPVGRRPSSLNTVLPDLWAPLAPQKDPTLMAALVNWQKKHPLPRRDTSMETQLKLWVRALGESTKMSAVTELQVRRLVDALPISNASRNRYVSALGSAYKYARGQGGLGYDGVSPTKGVRYDEVEGKLRKTALTQLEIEALLAASLTSGWPKLRLFLLIALTTGMRRSNILWLRWRDLDEESGLMTAGAKPGREHDPTKNGTAFTTILHPEVVAEAARFRGLPDELLFENTLFNGKPMNIDKNFKEAVRKAGLNPRVSPHWLRHTAATIAARSGASSQKLMRAMNWKSEQMANTYCHLNVEDIRDVASAMGGVLRKRQSSSSRDR